MDTIRCMLRFQVYLLVFVATCVFPSFSQAAECIVNERRVNSNVILGTFGNDEINCLTISDSDEIYGMEGRDQIIIAVPLTLNGFFCKRR